MVAPIAFSIWNISFDSYTEIQNKNKGPEPNFAKTTPLPPTL